MLHERIEFRKKHNKFEKSSFQKTNFAPTKANFKMDTQKFNHSTPIQLRFNDFDALGHVNNSIYLSFYDLGKTSYFKEVLLDISEKKDVGVVIANIEVNFQLPVYPGENVAVETAVVEIGTKSFKLLQQLIDLDTNEVKCISKTVMVCYDANTKTTRPISDEWRNAISAFERMWD